jgi:hypothetical protein
MKAEFKNVVFIGAYERMSKEGNKNNYVSFASDGEQLNIKVTNDIDKCKGLQLYTAYNIVVDYSAQYGYVKAIYSVNVAKA